MKLSESNKNKLIGGVIGVSILFATLFIKDCFDKRKGKEVSPPQIENQNTATATDSATQSVIQQTNKNQGAVNNEFVQNKNVYPASRAKSQTDDTKGEPKMEVKDNHGFINSGGEGNTYNQTLAIQSLPRHITQKSLAWIQSKLPPPDKDGSVHIEVYNPTPESTNLANEFVGYLQSAYPKLVLSSDYIMTPRADLEYGTVDIKSSPDGLLITIKIYPIL